MNFDKVPAPKNAHLISANGIFPLQPRVQAVAPPPPVAAAPKIPGLGAFPFMSPDEVEGLMGEVAGRVNLFKDIWAKDPGMRIGHSTVDRLGSWLHNQFKGADSREAVEAKIADLMGRQLIDIREFTQGTVDIHAVGEQFEIDPGHYGVHEVRRIDLDRMPQPKGAYFLSQTGLTPAVAAVAHAGETKFPHIGKVPFMNPGEADAFAQEIAGKVNFLQSAVGAEPPSAAWRGHAG